MSNQSDSYSVNSHSEPSYVVGLHRRYPLAVETESEPSETDVRFRGNPQISEPEEDPSEEHSSQRQMSDSVPSEYHPSSPVPTMRTNSGPRTITRPRKRVMPGQRFQFTIGAGQPTSGPGEPSQQAARPAGTPRPVTGHPVALIPERTQVESAQIYRLTGQARDLHDRVSQHQHRISHMDDQMEIFYGMLIEKDAEVGKLRRIIGGICFMMAIIISAFVWLMWSH